MAARDASCVRRAVIVEEKKKESANQALVAPILDEEKESADGWAQAGGYEELRWKKTAHYGRNNFLDGVFASHQILSST